MRRDKHRTPAVKKSENQSQTVFSVVCKFAFLLRSGAPRQFPAAFASSVTHGEQARTHTHAIKSRALAFGQKNNKKIPGAATALLYLPVRDRLIQNSSAPAFNIPRHLRVFHHIADEAWLYLGSAAAPQSPRGRIRKTKSRLSPFGFVRLFVCEVAFVCESSDTNEITNIYYYWLLLDFTWFFVPSSNGAQTEMLISSVLQARRHQSPAVCEGSRSDNNHLLKRRKLKIRCNCSIGSIGSPVAEVASNWP